MAHERTLRTVIHNIVTVYILFGGLLARKSCRYLWFHVIFCLLVLLHWATNDNKCFLSEYDHSSENGYTLETIRHVFGIEIPTDDTFWPDFIAHATVLVPMFVSMWIIACLDANKNVAII